MVNSEQTQPLEEATQQEQAKELNITAESSPTPGTSAFSATVLKERLTSLMASVPVPSTPAAKRATAVTAVGTGAATTAAVVAMAIRSTPSPEFTPISSQWTLDAFSNMSSNDMSKLSDAPGYLASAGAWMSDKASVAWEAIYSFGHAIATAPVDLAKYLGLPEFVTAVTGIVSSSMAFLLRNSADMTGWSAQATKDLGDMVASTLEAGATLVEENPAATTLLLLSSTAAVAGLAGLKMHQNKQAKLKELADAAQKAAAAASASPAASVPTPEGSSASASSNDATPAAVPAASNDGTPAPAPATATVKPR